MKVRVWYAMLLYRFASCLRLRLPSSIRSQANEMALARSQSDYSAARETDLDCLGLVAGFWLSAGFWLFMGTSYDRPNMSVKIIVFCPTSTSRSRPAAYFTVSSPSAGVYNTT